MTAIIFILIVLSIVLGISIPLLLICGVVYSFMPIKQGFSPEFVVNHWLDGQTMYFPDDSAAFIYINLNYPWLSMDTLDVDHYEFTSNGNTILTLERVEDPDSICLNI